MGVTGDGINDSLALKQADVGVAMGITGTDVAKEASDMIITDDNFATIVAAVEEGRIIFENMKSSVKYLVGANIGEVLALLFGIIAGWPLILTPIQILYINLATDGLPALGLAAVPSADNVMKSKPRMKDKLFDGHDLRWLAETSVLMAFVTLIAFAIGMPKGTIFARTLAFSVSIFAQQCIFLDLQARDKSFLRSLSNRNYLPFIVTIPVLLQLAILYVPSVSHVFKVTAIPLPYFLLTIGIASLLLMVSEFRKTFFHHRFYAS